MTLQAAFMSIRTKPVNNLRILTAKCILFGPKRGLSLLSWGVAIEYSTPANGKPRALDIPKKTEKLEFSSALRTPMLSWIFERRMGTVAARKVNIAYGSGDCVHSG